MKTIQTYTMICLVFFLFCPFIKASDTIYVVADKEYISDSAATHTRVNVNIFQEEQLIVIHKVIDKKIGISFEIEGIYQDAGLLEFIVDLYPDRSVADTIYQPDSMIFIFKFGKNINFGDTTYLQEPLFYFSVRPKQLLNSDYYDLGNLANYIKEFSLKYYFQNETITPENYGIYYLNSFDTKWYSICDKSQPNGIISKENYYNYGQNYISNNIKHFSIFSISKKRIKQSFGVDNIVVYPNPFVPNDNNLVTGRVWDGTPGSGIIIGIDSDNDGYVDKSFKDNFEITIYNLIGERIKTYLKKVEYGFYVWDGKTDSGTNAATGLYFAVIEYNGEKIIKRIAIVR